MITALFACFCFLTAACNLPQRCRYSELRAAKTPWPADWFIRTAAGAFNAENTEEDVEKTRRRPVEHSGEMRASEELALGEVIDIVRPSVVRIEVEEASGKLLLRDFRETADPFPLVSLFSDPFRLLWDFATRALGPYPRKSYASGFFIHRNGLVVTNYHVIATAAKVKVFTFDGREFPAVVLGGDKACDLALLRVDTGERGYPPLLLRDDRSLAPGQDVLLAGHPFNYRFSVSRGVVSAVRVHVGFGPKDAFIFTDCDINPGDSGGPLVDMTGRAVGINSAGFFYGKKAAFAIPASFLVANFDRLISNTPLNRPMLGVLAMEETLPERLVEPVGHGRGVRVAGKTPELDRALLAAGVRLPEGAVITRFQGFSVKSIQDLVYEVNRCRARQEIELEYVVAGMDVEREKTEVERKTIRFRLPCETLRYRGVLR